MRSEEELIARIRAVFSSRNALGETEDGDAWRIESLLATHVTTDVVVEGVDFDRALYPLRYAGHRALAQNLSDLYACDAEPQAFCWSLAIPPAWSVGDVVAFATGAASLASSLGVSLLGGDLSSTTGPLTCAITAIGRTPGVPVKRSGARAGQSVWLTKKVGASARGLQVLQRARAGSDDDAFAAFVKGLDAGARAAVGAHVEPVVVHGLDSLADYAVAAIDVSDGLVKDAARLARASGIAIDLDGLLLAVDPAADVDDALYGGEDWAVLFCVPDGLGDPPGCVRVGRVVDGAGVWRDGKQLEERGYDHFGGG